MTWQARIDWLLAQPDTEHRLDRLVPREDWEANLICFR